jgi:LytR cell envelope-related transcriptional attenuator
VIAAVAVVVGVLLILTSGGGSKTKTAGTQSTAATSTPAASKHQQRKTAQPAAFNPASVTVAVLNGTATNQLAHRVALKLDAAGFKTGKPTTAPDQTHTTTVVAYMPGHKRDATKVAASLNLGPASVQAIDAATQGVACPAGTPCTATVVVTAGSDLANIQ